MRTSPEKQFPSNHRTSSETRRFANFCTAADTFDANHDGEINLLEFATAQNPNAGSRAILTAIRNASALEITYTRSPVIAQSVS